ncbi:MAG: cupredoxin domain-containing protein [Thermoleophilaceae bacterium]
MRSHRLLPLPLALLLALAAAAPASALDWDVAVTDFRFTPRERAIDVGDTVIWRFADGGHTTTAARGQAERWSSGPTTTPSGGTFRKTFSRSGRFQYYCIPHQGFMKGVVQVGEDEVGDTIDALETKRRGSGVTVSFELNEPAKVTFKLKGASRRTVRRGRLRAGEHSFRVKGLDAGSHTGTLVAVDDFDKRDSAKRSFAIR